MESALLRKLKTKQAQLKLSDAGMGGRLGVSRQYWQHVKTGNRQMGVKFLQGVLSGFPELTADCLFFMGQNATELAEADSPEAPETHQDKRQMASDAPAAS